MMNWEAGIIAGLKNGDEEAVEALIKFYGDGMLRTALAITGDIQVAEEVVQDAFLQVCLKIHSFRQQSFLQTWIFRITINLARNRLRNWWFRRVIDQDGFREDLVVNSVETNPEAIAIRRENQQRVIDCLQEMPIKYREVLVLYYLEELSLAEICRVLKQPEGTVKSKLFRARALLKTKIQAKGVDY
jgi:RNA polymerase sigma-70 factor (ECF subfamily)